MSSTSSREVGDGESQITAHESQSQKLQARPRSDPPNLEWAGGTTTTSLETKAAVASKLKRESTEPPEQPASKKPRITKTHDEYRKLVNVEIQDISTPDADEQGTFLRGSQIGASVWTAEEKEAFFRALAVLGRDDIQSVAARIKTKSTLEVTLYLQLLHRGMVEKHLNERRQELLGVIDMPAALEISHDCCRLLDQAAALLELQQNQAEVSVEKRKWDDLWLLTPDIAYWMEQKISEGEDGLNEVGKMLSAGILLNLKTCLELSERIFMNPASPKEDDNWYNVSESGEPPSMRATAFADLANLTVSITERLVQATLFHAMSRCRAMGSKQPSTGFSVEARDVRSACTVLGMPHDSKGFWAKAARRCGLQVYEKISDMGSCATDGLHMSYDKVEAKLGARKSRLHASPQKTEEEIDQHEIRSRDMDGDAIQNANRSRSTSTGFLSQANHKIECPSTGSSFNFASSSLVRSTHSTEPSESDLENPYSQNARVLRKRKSQRELEAAQDAYMEALDLKNSAIEEDRLWKMVDQGSQPQEVMKDDSQVPERPIRERKGRAELIDWRDKVGYWTEWETSKSPVPKEMFLRAPGRPKSPQRSAGAADIKLETDSSDQPHPALTSSEESDETEDGIMRDEDTADGSDTEQSERSEAGTSSSASSESEDSGDSKADNG